MLEPVVGETEEYNMQDSERVPWLLGTHLNKNIEPISRASEGSKVLMIEAYDFSERKYYHHDKLTIIYSGMRHLRDELEEEGYDVIYIKSESFGDALEEYFDDNPNDTLVQMRSPSHNSEVRFRELVDEAGGELEIVQNELFVGTREAFDEWANKTSKDPFKHENFYRWMRSESGVLMTDEDEPEGGDWNYDDENQEFPPEDWESPPVYNPDHDELTEETSEWVQNRFNVWGDCEDLVWPVTREQALERLEHFVTERLPDFGEYQDAMRGDDNDWAMSHALIGSSINAGLLHPMEAIERIEKEYHNNPEIPLNSTEGVIRQIIGWREFMRHVYRHNMPGLSDANQLDAEYELPDFYWSGDTDMECIKRSVEGVQKRGYSHHIQRLMVLANFATLWGSEPKELNEWFNATYVDAYHWVTTPNVIEMGQFGQGVFATKPYVSTSNYIDKMSDYCSDCKYYKTKDTGENACPFNSLYWDFLDRNEDKLRSNHRMGLMYSHVDNKQESGDMDDIRERVEELREMQKEDKI
jgi:deoxyribodipyrimidine photolyase-related protein